MCVCVCRADKGRAVEQKDLKEREEWVQEEAGRKKRERRGESIEKMKGR